MIFVDVEIPNPFLVNLRVHLGSLSKKWLKTWGQKEDESSGLWKHKTYGRMISSIWVCPKIRVPQTIGVPP